MTQGGGTIIHQEGSIIDNPIAAVALLVQKEDITFVRIRRITIALQTQQSIVVILTILRLNHHFPIVM
jgi:hypothetical protein